MHLVFTSHLSLAVLGGISFFFFSDAAYPAKPDHPLPAEITRAVPPPVSQPHFLPDITLQYRFAWSFVKAASATLTIKNPKNSSTTPPAYSLQLDAQTEGMVKALWHYDADFQSSTYAKTLKPGGFTLKEHVKSAYRTSVATFEETKFRIVRQTQPDPPKPKTYWLPHAQDIFTATLRIRSQPLTPGAKFSLIVSGGSSPYLVNCHIHKKTKIKVHGQDYPAIEIQLKLQKIDKDYSLKAYDKAKDIRLYISDDDLRIPLRIQADVFIGSVVAELDAPPVLQ